MPTSVTVAQVKVDYELGSLAASQAGFLGHGQVSDAGLSEDAIRWRLRQGVWVPAGRGLYRVEGMTGDHKGLLRGAMAILPDPTISHESAAEVHEIAYVRKGKAAVTVHAGTTHNFPGVTIHRSLDLAPHHRAITAGALTTTAARTLVDLAAVLHPEHLARVLDEALAAGNATIDEVQSVFDEVARRGRTGSAAIRTLLGERLGSDLLTATKLERVGMQVFENGGLPRPVFQYPAPWEPTRYIDFAWPHFRIGCECDSKRWHTRINDFHNDRSRDNLALAHNWRIYRFTWKDFRERPDLVVSQLSAALAA